MAVQLAQRGIMRRRRLRGRCRGGGAGRCARTRHRSVRPLSVTSRCSSSHRAVARSRLRTQALLDLEDQALLDLNHFLRGPARRAYLTAREAQTCTRGVCGRSHPYPHHSISWAGFRPAIDLQSYCALGTRAGLVQFEQWSRHCDDASPAAETRRLAPDPEEYMGA
jgi:hypothetical protein